MDNSSRTTMVFFVMFFAMVFGFGAGTCTLITKDTLVGTSCRGHKNGDDKGTGSGCCLLDAGFLMLDS